MPDGACAALEGFTHLIPFAGGARDHPPAAPWPAPRAHNARSCHDQLIGMGCASRLTFSWGGKTGVGSLHGRDHSGGGLRSRSTMRHRRRIAPAPRSCRSACCAATSAPISCRRIRDGHVVCPFTVERLAAVPAINPDVTILHAQRASRRKRRPGGHRVGAARGRARRALVVTVEEIVEALPSAMNSIAPPHWVVSAVRALPRWCVARLRPWVCAPTTPSYHRWDAIARERDSFRALMQRHVLGSRGPPGISSPASGNRASGWTRGRKPLRRACCGTAASACSARPARPYLARLTHAPGIVLIYESGTLDLEACRCPSATASWPTRRPASCRCPRSSATTCRRARGRRERPLRQPQQHRDRALCFADDAAARCRRRAGDRRERAPARSRAPPPSRKPAVVRKSSPDERLRRLLEDHEAPAARSRAISGAPPAPGSRVFGRA